VKVQSAVRREAPETGMARGWVVFSDAVECHGVCSRPNKCYTICADGSSCLYGAMLFSLNATRPVALSENNAVLAQC
jgi:hypothetical protein